MLVKYKESSLKILEKLDLRFCLSSVLKGCPETVHSNDRIRKIDISTREYTEFIPFFKGQFL